MIKIDASSHTPVYEQVRTAIAGKIMDGDLSSDARLPSVRQLASDLAIAPGTVARAYRELEHDGLLTTHRRRGVFVAGPAIIKRRRQRQDQRLATAARTFATKVVEVGASERSAIEAVRAALEPQ